MIQKPLGNQSIDGGSQRESICSGRGTCILKEHFFVAKQQVKKRRLEMNTHILSQNKCVGAVLMDLDQRVLVQTAIAGTVNPITREVGLHDRFQFSSRRVCDGEEDESSSRIMYPTRP